MLLLPNKTSFLNIKSTQFLCFLPPSKDLHFSNLSSNFLSESFPVIYKSSKMISLLKLARKWHKFAAIRRKQITPQQVIECVEKQAVFGESATAAKGHFVVYSTDQKRFSLPLEYLNDEIIRELFNMAEEEFGLPSKGPLTFPCDAEVLAYVISLVKEKDYGDIQRALAMSIVSCFPSLYLRHQEASHQLPICSF